MADIHFSCPYCRGSLVVDDEGAGWEVECPTCSQPIVIPLEDEIEEGIAYVETQEVDYYAPEAGPLPDEELALEITPPGETLSDANLSAAEEEEARGISPEEEDAAAVVEAAGPAEAIETPEAESPEAAGEADLQLEPKPEPAEAEAPPVPSPGPKPEASKVDEERSPAEAGSAPKLEREVEASTALPRAGTVLPPPSRPGARTGRGRKKSSEDKLTMRELRARWVLYRCAACGAVFKLARAREGAVVTCPQCGVRNDTGTSEKPAATAAPVIGQGPGSRGSEGVVPPASPVSGTPVQSGSAPKRVPLKFPTFNDKGEKLKPVPGVEEEERAREAEWVQQRDVPWDSASVALQVSGEFESAAQKENRVVRLLAGASILVVIAGLAAVAFSAAKRKRDATPREIPPAAIAPGNSAPAEAELSPADASTALFDSRFVLRTRGEAEAVMKGFLDAATLEERLRYTYKPENVKAVLGSRADLSFSGPVRYRRLMDEELRVIEEESLLLMGIENEDFTGRVAALHFGPGGYKVDWEWFTEYSEMPWLEFLERRPLEPVRFRVIAKQDDYYNFEFSDSERFDCYRLSNSDHTIEVFGYAAVPGEVADALRNAFRDGAGVQGSAPGVGQRQLRCILGLRFLPSESAPKMVEIVELDALSWASE